jgi:uncharacterized protein (TIGR03067 family)
VKLLGFSILAIAISLIGDDAELTKKDLQKMQGDWAAFEIIRDGNKLPTDDAQAYFRTVEGEAYSVSRYRKVMGTGTIKIDATKSPREINAQPSGAGAKLQKGIYEWDGDKLKINFGPPGGDRPTDFKSPPGSGRAYTVWEREKK